MKKVTKVVAVLMIAALTVGSISVCAAETTERRERPAFSERTDAPQRGFGFRFGADHKAEGNKQPELTEEEKAAKVEEMKANQKKALDEQLAAGKITQEQYDEAIAKVEVGEFRFGFGFNGRNNAEQPKAWGRNWNKGEAPQRQELTEEEKAAKAEEMKANRKKALDEQLAAGKITQEQYDEAIAKVEAGEFGFPGQPHWGGRPGKFGGNRPMSKGFGAKAEKAD